MNFVDQKAEDASYNSSFRRNLIEICEKCILHFPEKKKNDFRAFLEEAYQIDFLKLMAFWKKIKDKFLGHFM